MNQSYDELRTIDEFRTRIRCGRTKAHQLITTRQIASVKIGKQVYIPESAIVEFLERAIRPVFNTECEMSSVQRKVSAILKTARRKVAETR